MNHDDLTSLMAAMHRREVGGVTSDSRRVKPGDIFVAIRGLRQDGREFIGEAVQRGARVVVGTDLPPLPEHVLATPVEDPRLTLALLVHRAAAYPSEALHVVGVTGTNGKTTVTYYLDAIFQAARRSSGLIGTIEVRVGQERQWAHMTTPDAAELAELFTRMVQRGVTEVAMEVSSHALAQHRVAGIEFDGAVFTNLDRDHLDFHKDLESYLDAKCALFRQLGNGHGSKKDPFAVINQDDPASVHVARHCRVPITGYGLQQPSDFRIENLQMGRESSSGVLVGPFGRVPIELMLPGHFNVYNALAAAAAAWRRGIEPASIAEGLQRLQTVPGRLQRLSTSDDVHIWVDFAHNPGALKALLRFAREQSAGRVILVFGAEGEKDRGKRALMGEAAAIGADFIVLTNDNPHREPEQIIFADVLQGLRGAAGRYMCVPDRREAIGRALAMAKPGDFVVVAGKGHETTQIVGEQAREFSDVKVIEQWLSVLPEPKTELFLQRP